MATVKQIEVIKQNLEVLGEQFNVEFVNSLQYADLQKYMTDLFDRANVVKRTRPSLAQIKMVEDMMKCPLLKQEVAELKKVPQRWLDMKQELCEYIVASEKFIANPNKSIKIADITGDVYECVLDYLVENQYLTMEQYKSALWLESAQIVQYVNSQINKLNISIRGNHLYKTIKQSTLKVEMELQKAKVRVAKANELIQNYEFNLATADKHEVAMWIEKNKEMYNIWLADRPTEGQIDLIMLQISRLNTDVYSTRMINEDGVEIKGNRWLHVHKCADLTREQILAMSKEGADAFIKQLEMELNNPVLRDVKVNEIYQETREEEIRNIDNKMLTYGQKKQEYSMSQDLQEVFYTISEFNTGNVSKEEVFNTMIEFLNIHSGNELVKGVFQ